MWHAGVHWHHHLHLARLQHIGKEAQQVSHVGAGRRRGNQRTQSRSNQPPLIPQRRKCERLQRGLRKRGGGGSARGVTTAAACSSAAGTSTTTAAAAATTTTTAAAASTTATPANPTAAGAATGAIQRHLGVQRGPQAGLIKCGQVAQVVPPALLLRICLPRLPQCCHRQPQKLRHKPHRHGILLRL